jgi:hypothetical protein
MPQYGIDCQGELHERLRLEHVLNTITGCSGHRDSLDCTMSRLVDTLVDVHGHSDQPARWTDQRGARRRFTTARVRADVAILREMGCVLAQDLDGHELRLIPVCDSLDTEHAGSQPHLTPSEVELLDAVLSEIIGLHFAHGRCVLSNGRDLDLLDCLAGIDRAQVEELVSRLADLDAVLVTQDDDSTRIVPLRATVGVAA